MLNIYLKRAHVSAVKEYQEIQIKGKGQKRKYRKMTHKVTSAVVEKKNVFKRER